MLREENPDLQPLINIHPSRLGGADADQIKLRLAKSAERVGCDIDVKVEIIQWMEKSQLVPVGGFYLNKTLLTKHLLTARYIIIDAVFDMLE